MVQYRHNEPYYKLQLSELDEDAVRVLAFEGKEQISHLFHYRLELLSEDAELDPAVILNKKATLLFSRGDEDPLPVYGIISHFEQRGRTPDYVSYYAELVPRMWRLELNFQSRVFQNMNIEQMITEVLETAEFAGEDFEFKLNETYPDIEFAVQYRETDFNFVNRRLEHFGIFYYFEHRDDNDVIVFTDVNDNLPAIETEDDISYNPNKDPLSEKETISRFTYQGQVVTGKTQLKDYNYQTPSKELIAESQINSDNPGIHSDYGDHFKDESEGEFQARLRDEEIVSRGTIYKGNGDCRPFHAGYKFTMNEHYREDWNQEFLLTQVLSRGNQRSLFGTFPPGTKVPPTYENYFESMPVEIPFRPQRLSMQPKITGVLNAKVDSAGDGSQAEVDDQGRYKVILPFDLSGNAEGEASCFIRMIQPYAGPNFGMHFPLHKDTEVLLTFIDGNPDFPVISGAVANPETISPVTNANQTKSVIRDNYGNEIVMDATPGDEHIRLYSPHHNSGLELGRSVVDWTDSNKALLTVGNTFAAGIGMKTDFYGGVATAIQAGAKHVATLGLSSSLTAGIMATVKYGHDFEWNYAKKSTTTKGEITESTQEDILSLSGKDHVLCAGDQMCLVGGATGEKKVRSIVNIYPDTITLTTGGSKVIHQNPQDNRIYENQLYENYMPSEDKWRPIVMNGVILSAIAGTIVPFVLDAISYGNEDRSKVVDVLSIIIMLAFYSCLGNEVLEEKPSSESMEKKEAGSEGERIEPVEHSNPAAKIEMKKDGNIQICSDSKDGELILNSKKSIGLGIGESGKEKSKVTMQENKIELQTGEAKIELGDNGDIFIKNSKADQKIRIVSVGSMTLDAGPKIDFLADKVGAPKGLFETKNIKDLG